MVLPEGQFAAESVYLRDFLADDRAYVTPMPSVDQKARRLFLAHR